jgi:hypothetical protein
METSAPVTAGIVKAILELLEEEVVVPLEPESPSHPKEKNVRKIVIKTAVSLMPRLYTF